MRRPSYFYTVKDRRAKTLSPAALATLQTSEQTKAGMAEIARLQKAGAFFVLNLHYLLNFVQFFV